MRSHLLALGALSLVPVGALAAPATPSAVIKAADKAAEADTLAWDFTEGLTTEVGPRLAGSAAEARGRAFAVAWLKAHGFANVHIEDFTIPGWERGEARAEVVAPFAQPLVLAALGGSGATPAGGVTAEVVRFDSFADLQAAPAGSLTGKIAYISNAMELTQDGSGYGFAGPARFVGPATAAGKGAVATLIKSIGTDHHRNPHTGNTRFTGAPAPAAALSVPDAEQLERIFDRAGGKPVTMHLVLTPRALGEVPSGNVIADIPGRDLSLPPVILACHMDSWDLGTGAIDDGAGCGIVAAAAKAVASAGQPLRTVRLLLAGSEEIGGRGGGAYAKAHGDKPVGAALESDFGADRVWRFKSNFSGTNADLHKKIARAVARFGVTSVDAEANGGEDIGIARDQKTAIIDLDQDGLRYFDLHHTPDDTLDKVDPAQLRQNVAVWTQVVGILANEPGAIKPQG
ncbi:MAG: M20/M25/M40 family metallo-hydrolase [Tsuneonella sp.]